MRNRETEEIDQPDNVFDVAASTLSAFLSCPEEDMESLLHGCLARTADDARAILTASSAAAGASGASTGTPHDTLQGEKSAQYVTSCELRYRDVLRAWEALANATTLAKHAVGGKGDTVGAPSTARLTVARGNTDVELLDLGSVQEVRMGSLVSMLRDDAMVVDTVFDNFVEEGSGGGAEGEVKGARRAEVTQQVATTAPRVSRPVPSLDDFLAVDGCSSDEGSGGADSSRHEQCSLSRAPAECSKEEDDDLSAPRLPFGAHASASSSSRSSLSLPGLGMRDGATEAQPPRIAAAWAAPDGDADSVSRADKSFAQDVYTALQRVRREVDDDVQSFALDPLFDYDHDIAGPTLREHDL